MLNTQRKTTPGGKQSSITGNSDATRPLDSGEPRTSCEEESELPRTSRIKPKQKHLLGTLNINTLIKTGKLKQLTDILNRRNILILALQETRYRDENAFESEGYRIYKGKPAIKNKQNVSILGTAFMVKRNLTESITNFTSPSERISLLSFRSANKGYTIINAHAPTNTDNRKNPEKVEQFWETLEDETSKIPKHHIKILVGDFNAQVGREEKYKGIVGNFPAHKRTNKNGERLINFCRHFDLKLMSTFFRKLPRRKKTWCSPNTHLGSYQLDHVAITKQNHREIMNVRVRRGLGIDSDHFLTEIKTKFQPKKPNPKIKKVHRIDTKFLSDNRDKFVKKLQTKKMGNWNEIREAMVETVKELEQPPRRRKHRWWNTICDEAIENRLTAWKKWNSCKKESDWITFTEIRKQTSKIIRTEKRRYDKKRLEEIDTNFRQNNTRDFYKVFKEEITGYKPMSLHFKDSTGKLVTNNKDNCELLAKYFKNLLNCEEPTQRLTFCKPLKENPPSEPPSLHQIENYISQLKNNRAPGEDGIVAEMWKLGGKRAAETIYEVIKDCWEKERIPDDWRQAIIHPLHKKGDRTDTNNYRGISLLPVTYKILSKALMNNIEAQAEHKIGEYQAGFRKSRSCPEQIFNLKTILRIRAMRNLNTVVTFVDFKKAYDSIDRQTVFLTLEEVGIDKTTRKLVEQTLTDTTSKVKFLGEVSEPFRINTGVRQGDGLSPILFNLVLDKVVREWERELKEKNIEGIHLGQGRGRFEVKCLAFADDIAIISKDRSDAKIMVETLHRTAAKTGLQVSYEKTEYIEHKNNREKYLQTQHGNIKRVEKFKYLGEWIQSNGLDNTTSKERSRKMELAYKLTQNRYNKRSVSFQAKIKHYATVIKPEALYGSECLTLNKKGEQEELEKKERKILRKILGPQKNKDNNWMKRRNEDLYRNIETITDSIRKRRLKFYGHIHRMNDNRLTKRIFNFISKLKNTTGWLAETKRDLRKLNVAENTIHDREQFRLLINSAKFPVQQPNLQPRRVMSIEQRQAISQRMKKFWEDKKKKSVS